MCVYITATVSAAAPVDDMRRLARANGIGWAPLEPSGFDKHLRPDERYFLTTKGHCDCHTQLGALNSEPRLRDPRKRRNKLKRKGWSDSKIDEWIDSEERSERRRREDLEAIRTDGSLEAERWYSFICEVVRGGVSPWVGLLMHSYRGLVSAEGIPLHERQVVDLASVDPEFLLRVWEDTLYEFRDSGAA